MRKHRSSRKRLSEHLETKHDTKKPKYSQYIDPRKSQSGYKHHSILPDVEELHVKYDISPHVNPNIDKGSYDNWDHYLNTQFNLLREDFVAPLRRAILDYEKGDELSYTSVYHQATFTKMLLNEDGLLLLVNFKAKNTSLLKTFINGTLLCFSSDNFKTILFATVVSQREENQAEQLKSNPVDQLIQVKVELDILDNLNILGINESGFISSSQTYTMIESPAHFETYYHVLKSLQGSDLQKMPFSEYLINHRLYKMRRPLYLTRKCHFDMSGVLKSKHDNDLCCFDITHNDCWPSCDVEGLDESQIKALQNALTHEVSLIQGPPGTGKTYIGGKIMEALLTNKAKWDPNGDSPILVVCYTNQALDQFFEILIDIKSKLANNRKFYHGGLEKELQCNPREIVRIGGGCNEIVKDYLLKNLNSVDWKKQPNKKRTKDIFVTNDKHNDYLCAQRKKFEKLNKKINHKVNLLFSNPPPIKELSEFIDPLHLEKLKSMHKCMDKCIGVWFKKNVASSIKGQLKITSTQATGQHLFSKSALITVNCNGMQSSSGYAMKYHQLDSYTKAEAQSILDIKSLSLNQKKKLYNLWIKQFHSHHYHETCTMIKEFDKIHKDYIDSRDRKYFEMLQKAHVICMTTTGAAKHKQLLEKLKPKIIIAEEAAEVFESHIIACLTANTQHLILIGDHEQLQPTPQEHLLARNYKLNVSLFKRLINNGVPCTPLQTQHRMRPEIADLVRANIYSKFELKDDASVQKYKNVKGITTNMYFFDHNYPEEHDDNKKSYSNKEEGNFVAKLCHYLLKHYKPNEVTVLTAYASQAKLLNEQIQVEKKNFDDRLKIDCTNEEYVKVKTIDDYQGKENTIIILSLVRSNDDNHIGFLSLENRICVALSRAKEGLYCFGNFTLLYNESLLWKKILKDLQVKKKVGSALQLHCVNHQLSITNITKPSDFEKVPHGGCWRQCNKYLDCGHRCMLKCHITDQDHKNYRCRETCVNKCKDCGEPCKHKCHISCSSQKCEALVMKIIPKCNHSQLVPCYMKPEKFRCQEKCDKTCFHGHPCDLMCSEECKPCMEAETINLDCGHKVTSYCFDNYAIPDCSAPCNKTCTTNPQNPHRCTKKCSDICGNCKAMVEIILPWCGHNQQMPCYVQSSLKLLADVVRCTTMIEATFPTCGHIVIIPCGESIVDYSCFTPVVVELPCGHSKEVECYKTQDVKKHFLASEKCMVKVSKHFHECKHVVDLPCCDSHLTECPVKCTTLLLCGHKCSGTCHECHQGRLHKPCMFHVSELLCGHETTTKCSSTMIEPYPSCSYRCEQFCQHKKCSHQCQVPCKLCNKPCEWQCLHYKCTRKCYENCNRQRCYKPCPHFNKCHHPCIGVCGERCPNVCKICDKELFLELYVSLHQFKTKDDTTYIQLDCGHLFKRTELDPWVDARSKHLQLICCPKCNQTIHLNQRRYANAIRRTHEGMIKIHQVMNNGVETNVKLEVLMRYYTTFKYVMEAFGLSDLKTFQGLSFEDLENFITTSDEELKTFAAACSKHTNTKFCQGIKKFIENKKENWLSAINVIINMLDSTLSLLKLSQGELSVVNSLEELVKFILANHESLSLQVIQDVTREQKRLALWIMANQLRNEILDYPDLQAIKQVENVINPQRFYIKPLLPQLVKQLYMKLSKIAKKYGVKLLDKKYIIINSKTATTLYWQVDTMY